MKNPLSDIQYPKIKNNTGLSVIEILVAIAVLSIALVSILGLASFSIQISTQIRENTQATNLGQETLEATRAFRDGTTWSTDGLGALTVDIDYYPQKSTGSPPQWQMIQGQETVSGFTRKVVSSRVSRNLTTDDIEQTYNPSNDDSGTRKATVTVSWKGKDVQIVSYLTNWRE